MTFTVKLSEAQQYWDNGYISLGAYTQDGEHFAVFLKSECE
jgi:hypothetical protein